MTTDQDPQSDSARLARMRRECSAVHPDVASARRAEIEREQAQRDQATREDERQRLIAAGWTPPDAEETRAIPVGSIHKAHLKPQAGPWCREMLLYSPDNNGDSPRDRVMLFTAGRLSDALDWAEKVLAYMAEKAPDIKFVIDSA